MASKFKQLATASQVDSDGDIIDILYALDEDGQVWRFVEDDERWEKLSSERFDGDD
jgi:Tfp pilus tip-associated adhesin PilY1